MCEQVPLGSEGLQEVLIESEEVPIISEDVSMVSEEVPIESEQVVVGMDESNIVMMPGNNEFVEDPSEISVLTAEEASGSQDELMAQNELIMEQPLAIGNGECYTAHNVRELSTHVHMRSAS